VPLQVLIDRLGSPWQAVTFGVVTGSGDMKFDYSRSAYCR